MTDSIPAQPAEPARSGFAYDPETRPELFDGVLSKRIVAFLIDATLIVLLMIPAALLVLVMGIAVGFVVAHKVNKTQRGREFFADVDARMREFTDTVAEAYREREAELRSTIDSLVEDAEAAIDDLNKR